MSMHNYNIFRAAPCTPLELVCLDYEARHDQMHAELITWAKRWNNTGNYYSRGGRLEGFMLEGDVGALPAHLRAIDMGDGSCVRAHGSTKAARAFRAEVEALPALPTWDDFTSKLGCSGRVFFREGRHYVARCFFHKFNSAYFILVPKEVTAEFWRTPMPAGGSQIPLSEYYAAKERDEQTLAEAEKGQS